MPSDEVQTILFCCNCKIGKEENKGKWFESSLSAYMAKNHIQVPYDKFRTWMCDVCFLDSKGVTELKGISIGMVD